MKQSELNIASHYEWNLMFMTFYDYLEQFLALGVLLRSDFLKFERPAQQSAINRAAKSENSPEGKF